RGQGQDQRRLPEEHPRGRDSLTGPDPKEIVARGYDSLAERHAEWSAGVRAEERERYTRLLLDLLPAGARLLELGCGVGLPTTARLAERYAVMVVEFLLR